LIQEKDTMKVLFIIDTSSLDQEPLGIMHISALLKQHGHTCEALDLSKERDLVGAVRERDPQLLAFSVVTGPHKRLVRASREIKQELDVLSILGGPHASYFPEVIEEDGVDIVCQGEGEYPMVELVEAMEAGRDFTGIRNLWVKRDGEIYRNPTRPFTHDLDNLPWPDRELFNPFPELHVKDTRHFMGGRGCPYDCTFCFNHIAKQLAEGRYVRWRSVTDLVGEIKAVKERYGMRFVNFQDDTFVLRMDWLEEFSARYRQEIGLPFLCHVRANLVNDHMSQLLADAGCVHVGMGLEAGNDHLRNVVLKKRISREQLIDACRSLRAHGITISTQNMFGLPFETIDTVLDTIELNIACQPERTNLFFYVPYPRTELAQIAVDEGVFQTKDLDSLPEVFTTEFSSVNLDLPNARQIEQLAKLTRFCVHFPMFFPTIRFLFKRKRGNWIKAAVSKSLLTLQGAYTRIMGGSVRLARPQE
jgi:anaerobic magnesium-protoporphyrin IX monomethyl ester cyclase